MLAAMRSAPESTREAPDLLSDITTVAFFTVLHLVLWRHVRGRVFEPLAYRIGLKARTAKKFGVSARELSFYLASFALASTLCWRHNSFWSLWRAGRIPSIPPDLKFVYLSELSWYFQGFVTLVSEPQKKDFVGLAAHHLITILLISWSYAIGHHSVGLLVIILHNASDPLLHLAKLLNYTNTEPACTIAFACFMVAFLISRLILLPSLVNNMLFHFASGVGREPEMNDISLTELLALLVPIHVYWFYLICRIAIRTLQRGRPERDERSEDNEGENVNAQGVDEAESEPGSEQKKNQQKNAQKSKSR